MNLGSRSFTLVIYQDDTKVSLTHDEKVALTHNDTLLRVSLHPDGDDTTDMQINELSGRKNIALTLKNGVRAHLLVEVLRSAVMVGGKVQTIVENLPGNSDLVVVVAHIMKCYFKLTPHVALIMIFDLWCMCSSTAQ